MEEANNFFTYKVIKERRTDAHLVTFDVENNGIVCSCKKFEFVGI